MRHTAGLVLTFCLLVAAAVSARAETLAEALYRTQAIVTGTGETNRQLGFEECFREVLVKVSGDQRLLAKAAITAELPVAGRYVESFRYRDRLEGIPVHDEQGTHDRPHDLYCSFSRQKIDVFLATLGARPWLAERPKLVLFLGVRTSTKDFVLTRDGADSPYMRDSLLAAAAPLAMTVDVPDGKAMAAAGLEPAALASAEWPLLEQTTARMGGMVPLRGSLVWSDAELGWIAQWQILASGHAVAWQVRGVSFDDAFRNAMAGALQVLSGNGQPQ